MEKCWRCYTSICDGFILKCFHLFSERPRCNCRRCYLVHRFRLNRYQQCSSYPGFVHDNIAIYASLLHWSVQNQPVSCPRFVHDKLSMTTFCMHLYSVHICPPSPPVSMSFAFDIRIQIDIFAFYHWLFVKVWAQQQWEEELLQHALHLFAGDPITITASNNNLSFIKACLKQAVLNKCFSIISSLCWILIGTLRDPGMGDPTKSIFLASVMCVI